MRYIIDYKTFENRVMTESKEEIIGLDYNEFVQMYPTLKNLILDLNSKFKIRSVSNTDKFDGDPSLMLNINSQNCKVRIVNITEGKSIHDCQDTDNYKFDVIKYQKEAFSTSGNIFQCFEDVSNFLSGKKNNKVAFELIGEKLAEINNLSAIQCLKILSKESSQEETLFSVTRNGLNFGKSLGARTRIDYDAEDGYTFRCFSDSSVNKQATYDTLPECLEYLAICHD